jgi:hypothetical protein
VNTLITEPGTAEVDWNNAWSFSTSGYAMPSVVKYTPEGTSVIWGRTEYSMAFDSLTSAQALTLTATSVARDGEKFDFAIAPQATFFLRNQSGARLGAIAIARYDTGRNSIGATASWSGATSSSASNPASTFDLGFGFGRQLFGSRLLEKLTPHFNGEWERSTGISAVGLLFEGIELQLTERLALDLSGQHSMGGGRAVDHQIALGMTVNLGKLR